jgi:hypothetical protein
MNGSVHGPGGKLIVELLHFHLLTILSKTKMKRKEAMKVIVEKGM